MGKLLLIINLFWVINTNIPEKTNNFVSWEDIEIEKRGASSKKNISNSLISALKRNDFSMISGLIPQENELEYLKRTIDKKDKYILDNLESDDLKANTKKNFETVIERGIHHKITWAEIETIDQKEEKINDNFYKVFIAAQDMKGKTIRISYDALKIKNRWFLFQGIRVEQCLSVKNNCPAGL